jgi:hypothetical protein
VIANIVLGGWVGILVVVVLILAAVYLIRRI